MWPGCMLASPKTKGGAGASEVREGFSEVI